MMVQIKLSVAFVLAAAAIAPAVAAPTKTEKSTTTTTHPIHPKLEAGNGSDDAPIRRSPGSVRAVVRNQRHVQVNLEGEHEHEHVHKAGHTGKHHLKGERKAVHNVKHNQKRKVRNVKASHHNHKKLERAEVTSTQENVDSGIHHKRRSGRKAHKKAEQADVSPPPVNADSTTLSARDDLVEELEQRSPQLPVGFRSRRDFTIKRCTANCR